MAQNRRSPDLPTGDGPLQAMIGEPPPAVGTDISGVLPGAAPLRTLLVVDYLPSVRTSVAYYLEVCGYRTFKADSGLAALETYRREQIDGVLLDIQMPGMNGFQTCTELQVIAREKGRQLPVWFMTGIHYRELAEEAAQAGGRTVFHKPFEWTQLLAELEQCFALLPPRSGRDVAFQTPSS